MEKIKLNDITLCSFCWGDNFINNTLRSMLICMDKCEFDDVIMITNTKDIDNIEKHDGIRVQQVSFDLNNNLKNDDVNRENFSKIFLENLNKFITTEYCLTVQPDSTIINVCSWTNEFLDYDYIGAPWPLKILTSSDMCANKINFFPNTVGNGGFSIRSKKFIECSLKMETYHKNEDLNLCIFNYQKMRDLGITFAPKELACKFSLEHPIDDVKEFNRDTLFTYNSFGFHGTFNSAGMDYIDNYFEEKV